MDSTSQKILTPSRRRRARRNARFGHVTVEMAFALPVAFAFFWGCVEVTRMNTLANAAENAAYDGARMGMIPGTSAKNVSGATKELLDAAGVQYATIDVTPSVITELTLEVTVTVSVPLNQNHWGVNFYGADKTIIRQCTLTREMSFARGS
ncbi:MAG: pilus assembly protein [Planctomycetaceae bacterium]|nr:pilus assembly protein [Planctomycetales bacterium]MCB9921436.1 pilus assembly protein [Planctomycetaceae bacterium]